MADYFTSDHFKLLNRWKGQRRDESNPEQNRAYENLKNSCEATEAWAGKVKEALFPVGRVEIRLKANGTDKYGLSQSDFYQLQA